ncbi:hypothetical protein CDD81_2975 [Ophiocordyceps australis]|uniref:Basic proline-rich protein n=1 Tax=Ophiocordyceps australis TaxID=1399860 RepID=A0A2C5YHL8_9HYPO|nr:hypothetical protein CDD81_2975 [Ophiocordyceps australis]
MMEPVPETERLEDFGPSPVLSRAMPSFNLDATAKPPAPRRTPDATPPSPTPTWSSPALPHRPRTTSPLSSSVSCSHSRSRSVASLALPLSRTQSMPGVNGSGRILYSPQLRPTSPLTAPSPRLRSPRKPVDEAFPTSPPARYSVLDVDRRPRPPLVEPSTSPSHDATTMNLSRLRRPSSPLRSIAHPPASPLALLPSTPSSTSSLKTYDGVAWHYGTSLSSVPSTPTSTRSRSPSISSLETIPDSPDAEEAALEAERLSRAKADADAADGAAESLEHKGRHSTELPTRGRTMSFGSMSSRDKRKRWSVCGAERRGDIDLETIWED